MATEARFVRSPRRDPDYLSQSLRFRAVAKRVLGLRTSARIRPGQPERPGRIRKRPLIVTVLVSITIALVRLSGGNSLIGLPGRTAVGGDAHVPVGLHVRRVTAGIVKRDADGPILRNRDGIMEVVGVVAVVVDLRFL